VISVFSCLDIANLYNVCRVSKLWNALSSLDVLWKNLCICDWDKDSLDDSSSNWKKQYQILKQRKVLILYGTTDEIEYKEYIQDIISHIAKTKQFTRNQIEHCNIRLKQAPNLHQYGSILVFSDQYTFETMIQQHESGDLLCSYLNAGGGVVEAVFVIIPTVQLLGDWSMHGHSAIKYQNTFQAAWGKDTLEPVVPDHPLLRNVKYFCGGEASYRSASDTIHSSSTLVAKWREKEYPLVVCRNDIKVVTLNFFPPSSNCKRGPTSKISTEFWDAKSDGGIIMANALTYVYRKDS